MTPREANTIAKICTLNRDNTSSRKAYIGLDEDYAGATVYIGADNGIHSLSMPKRDFNRLVDWYLKDQTPRKNRSTR